jgi:hypothetical protein
VVPLYKVYEVTPRSCYYGYALVAANSAEEANEHISVLKDLDPTNKWDYFGWEYVTEDDIVENIFADCEGIVKSNIRYSG